MKNLLKDARGFTLIELLIVFVFFIGFCGFFCFFVGGWCWEYVVETWAAYNGNPKDVNYWICCCIGVIPVIGWLSFPAAAITWMAMIVLV